MPNTVWERVKSIEQLPETYSGELMLTVSVYNSNGRFNPKELLGAKFTNEQEIKSRIDSLNKAGHGIDYYIIHYNFFVERGIHL